MAGSLNKVQLIGHLGADPTSKSFQSGGKVVNLRIATSETWKDRTTGEKKERTEWHSIAIFNEPTANYAEQYLRKGSKVYIEGQLETRKWQDQSGADRYSTEITIRPFNGQVIGLDKAQGASADDRYGGQNEENRSRFGGGSDRPRGGGGGRPSDERGSGPGMFDNDLDDDVPF